MARRARRAGALVVVAGAALVAAAQADGPPEPGGLGAAGFAVRFEPERLEAREGDAGAVSLTLAPASGLRIDRRGPLRLELSVEPDAGLDLVRARYERKHAADARADSPRFDLRYRARSPGAYSVFVELRFWLCRKHTCWPVSDRRELNAVVSAAESTADAGPR